MSETKDYKFALMLGLIIGIFLIPLEYNTGLGTAHRFLYPASVIGFPILALLGLWIGKLLFSRIRGIWQFVKFALVGVSNTAINFGVLNALVAITGISKGWPIYLFESIAFVCALFNSYIWNSHWSFESKNHRTTLEFVEFFLVTFIGSQINSLIVYLIATHVHPILNISQPVWINVANIVGVLVVMFWNFFGFKMIVFRQQPQMQPQVTDQSHKSF